MLVTFFKELMTYKTLTCLLVAITTSCSQSPWVTARTEYIDMKKLPSVAVDTPDPIKDTAYWGEKLLIRWDTGQDKSPTTLHARIRLRNGTEKTIDKVLEGSSGVEYFTLDAYEYDQSGGIISYKIELLANGESVANSTHKLWVEKI